MGMLIYINFIYRTYIIGEFEAYPEPVAAKLRRALYYTNIDVQPKNALKYYRQALALADEMGLDPFSDEMLGVKIQVASFFEKIHQYQLAIDVLEKVRGDCLKWMEKLGGHEGNEGKRTRVLGKTIAISVKLGEHYANPHVGDQDAAEERLVWAVTALLREQKRREDEGVKEGEGQWMSNEEIGGSLEALGHLYESRDQHFLATPLFLQALGLSPPGSCHTVVLMNNLAISLAQQNPPPSFSPNQPPVSSASHLSDARQWAEKSLALESSIKPPERTAECDEGCAVAMINLGDFAMMEGNLDEAERRYEDGKKISMGMGFQEGVAKADELLKDLKKKR
ncbi:MAG: hypothetical protein Q9161_008775 [Pseudevernia consocians]